MRAGGRGHPSWTDLRGDGRGRGVNVGLSCSAFGSRQFSFSVLLSRTGWETMSLNLILGKVRADGPPGYVIPQALYEQLQAGIGEFNLWQRGHTSSQLHL